MNAQASHTPSQKPPKQVITISETGEITSLRRKPGEGIDLRKFGAAEITRASDILFSDTEQKFYVRFLTGALAGRDLTHALYGAATGETVLFKASKPVMLFAEYEDAVRAEIKVLDAIAKNGWQPSAAEISSLTKELA